MEDANQLIKVLHDESDGNEDTRCSAWANLRIVSATLPLLESELHDAVDAIAERSVYLFHRSFGEPFNILHNTLVGPADAACESCGPNRCTIGHAVAGTPQVVPSFSGITRACTCQALSRLQVTPSVRQPNKEVKANE
jgi:hypothetical protein